MPQVKNSDFQTSDPKISHSPYAHYQELITQQKILPDAMQLQAVKLLDALFHTLTKTAKPEGFFKRLWRGLSRKQTSVKNGLYVWGGVGRGKSMVMDLFMHCIKPHIPSKRVHFHAFMLDVHKRLHAFRQMESGDDLMPKLIANIAAEQRVLCLDEFEVHDVTDAAILARLFGGLLQAGICVIFTSNRAPHDLYPGGLQRDQFLRFVDDILTPNITIFALNGQEDYRLKQMLALKTTYYYPRNEAADSFLLESWAQLTQNAESEPISIEVNGRILKVEKHVHGFAWLTFNELCLRPLGVSDYLALSQELHTVLLQGIPPLSAEQRNEARRFVMLIDALYDHRIKCLFTAQTPPEGIYAHGDGNFEFARTVSRLKEMQSAKYLAQTKRQP
jgi:cell division protein ZapE